MVLETLMKEDHASLEDVERAIVELTDVEAIRLENVARFRALGLRGLGLGVNAEDLLQEAITRTIEGRRRWKREISFVKHLIETMRSISSHERERFRKAKVKSPVRELEGDESGLSSPLSWRAPDSEVIAAACQQKTAIFERFAEDPTAEQVLDGLQAEMTGPEIQEVLEISQREYETVMTRIRRSIDRKGGWRP